MHNMRTSMYVCDLAITLNNVDHNIRFCHVWTTHCADEKYEHYASALNYLLL